jgi:hypothetical protein
MQVFYGFPNHTWPQLRDQVRNYGMLRAGVQNATTPRSGEKCRAAGASLMSSGSLCCSTHENNSAFYPEIEYNFEHGRESHCMQI